MLPQSQASKCSNFAISNCLFIILLSPLPRSPGYWVNCPANYPASNRAGHSPRYPVRNPVNYLDRYSVSYSADYPEGNPASCLENCGDRCSPSCSADSPENRSGSNPESNLPSNLVGNSQDYWENYPADSLAGYLGDYRCGSVNRSDAGGQLLQFDDFADSLRLCFTHEVDTGRQGMHIIRAGMKVEDPAAVYREE